mmetsp:Transcript_19123/g.27722  ORF Transcript_19123/g.27722 Transcript_19123/m.27722 type:complete len:152 (+) Transcript_19123:210-665(+)
MTLSLPKLGESQAHCLTLTFMMTCELSMMRVRRKKMLTLARLLRGDGMKGTSIFSPLHVGKFTIRARTMASTLSMGVSLTSAEKVSWRTNHIYGERCQKAPRSSVPTSCSGSMVTLNNPLKSKWKVQSSKNHRFVPLVRLLQEDTLTIIFK